jgi:hypothetical protein
MRFEEALAAARAGQKVRSLKWTPGTYFALSESPECPQDPRKFFWLYQNYGATTPGASQSRSYSRPATSWPRRSEAQHEIRRPLPRPHGHRH